MDLFNHNPSHKLGIKAIKHIFRSLNPAKTIAYKKQPIRIQYADDT